MVFLVNALAISFKRIIFSLFNIIIFRYVYEFIRTRLITGVMGFLLSMYACDYIRKFFNNQYTALKKRSAARTSTSTFHEFNSKNLESLVLDYDQFETLTDLNIKDLNKHQLRTKLETFKANAKLKCKNDLFDFIFNAATHSFLLSFATMIAIEYVQNKYELSVIQSILYCVTLPFIICFGSSYRYSSLVCQDWLEIFETTTSARIQFSKRSNRTIVYYRKPGGEDEVVCMWSSLYDVKTKVTTVELKFLNSSYADRLGEVVEYYVMKHVDLIGDTTSEYFDFVVADFYNGGQAFANRVRKSKMVKVESWTEFILMPMVNFSVSIYSNKKLVTPTSNGRKSNKEI